MTVQSDDPNDPQVTGVATAVDNCDPVAAVTSLDETAPGDCPQSFTILRRWFAVDNCNNAVACTQTIVVQDNSAPQLACPQDVTVQCDQELDPGLNAPIGSAFAEDNCDPAPAVTYEDVETPGSCPQAITITRTWTATDACGNATTCVQTITVIDDTPPVITCPPSVTIQCDESTDPWVNPNVGVATAEDNCDQTPSVTYIDLSDVPGQCQPYEHIISRSWLASDDCNNAVACSQIISVRDTEAPVWTFVPESLDLQCDGVAPPVENATASDNCDTEVTVTYNGETVVQGQCAGSTIITRSWTAVDDCNNVTTTVQVIAIQDSQPPVFAGVPDNLTLECDEAIPQPESPTASDFCDPEPVVTYQGE